MSGIRRFFGDRRGGMMERMAVLCGMLALASIAGAHFLDIASRDGNSSLYALFGRKPGVDYTATATIHKQAGQTVLDPCTGKAK